VPPPLLRVSDLKTTFRSDDGVVSAVNGLSFSVEAGSTLGIVGESGSGKSVTALSIMRLIPQPPGKIESGEVVFKGRDLLQASDREMRAIRGHEIAMIFQDPMTSLNPVLTVGDQIAEATRLHLGYSKKDSLDRAVDMLRLVRIPVPEKRVREYPHQFSGGMRQRVMIAMALSCDPAVLIADEPTTALDVTVQAQILLLLKQLQTRSGLGMLFISHDLAVVAQVADRVAVMRRGELLEVGTRDQVFLDPAHAYTRSLLGAVPTLHTDRNQPLATLATDPGPAGKLVEQAPGHWVRSTVIV